MKRPLSQEPAACYSRGYAAAMKKLYAWRQEWHKAFDRIRERTERAETGAGIGQCQLCEFWRRHEHCRWGYCDMERASRGPGWPMPWATLEPRDPTLLPRWRYCTAEKFGCINFTECRTRNEAAQNSIR